MLYFCVIVDISEVWNYAEHGPYNRREGWTAQDMEGEQQQVEWWKAHWQARENNSRQRVKQLKAGRKNSSKNWVGMKRSNCQFGSKNSFVANRNTKEKILFSGTSLWLSQKSMFCEKWRALIDHSMLSRRSDEVIDHWEEGLRDEVDNYDEVWMILEQVDCKT